MTVNRNSAITPDILLCIKKLKMSDRDHRFLGQHALLCFSACFIRPTCLQNKSLMRTNISPGTLLCSTLTVRWQSVSGGPRPSNAGNEKSGSHYQPSTLTPFAPVSAVCQALCAAVHQSPKAPAFPMSGALFDKKLKAVTQGQGNLSGHSFRPKGPAGHWAKTFWGRSSRSWETGSRLFTCHTLTSCLSWCYTITGSFFSHALPRTCS